MVPRSSGVVAGSLQYRPPARGEGGGGRQFPVTAIQFTQNVLEVSVFANWGSVAHRVAPNKIQRIPRNRCAAFFTTSSDFLPKHCPLKSVNFLNACQIVVNVSFFFSLKAV